MRNYFTLNLKGKDVWIPMMCVIILGIFVGMLTHLPTILCGLRGSCSVPSVCESTVLGWDLLWSVLAFMGGIVGFMVVVCIANFFITRKTVDGLSYKDAAFETDYNLKDYTWLVVKGTLLSVITFGIYSPWFITKLLNYFASNVTHNYNNMSFRGKPMTLLGIVVLFCVLPIVILPILFTLIFDNALVLGMSLSMIAIFVALLLYCVLAYRWLINFTYGNKRIVLKVSVGDGILFLLGQFLLMYITLGFYAPMAMLRIYRYFINRTVVGDEFIEGNFGMVLNPWRDWAYLWGQMLLCIVTLFIYSPWAYARISTRFIGKCYVDSVDKPKEPME